MNAEVLLLSFSEIVIGGAQTEQRREPLRVLPSAQAAQYLADFFELRDRLESFKAFSLRYGAVPTFTHLLSDKEQNRFLRIDERAFGERSRPWSNNELDKLRAIVIPKILFYQNELRPFFEQRRLWSADWEETRGALEIDAMLEELFRDHVRANVRSWTLNQFGLTVEGMDALGAAALSLYVFAVRQKLRNERPKIAICEVCEKPLERSLRGGPKLCLEHLRESYRQNEFFMKKRRYYARWARGRKSGRIKEVPDWEAITTDEELEELAKRLEFDEPALPGRKPAEQSPDISPPLAEPEKKQAKRPKK